MSLLITRGLGFGGTGGGGSGGDLTLDVTLEAIDTIVVEQETMGVQLEDVDFGVKIVEKVTTVIKE